MTLVLKNLQNIIKLRMCQLEKDIIILRRLMNIEMFDVSVLFVKDDYIRKLNEKYRQCEGATDVLAFPALEITQAGIVPESETNMLGDDEVSLGDLLLAPEYIFHQCKRCDENFNFVILTTVTHGLCHLLGYDHETEEQQCAMLEQEHTILKRFNRLTGYSCRPLTVVGH